jgi:hypothetical protein
LEGVGKNMKVLEPFVDENASVVELRAQMGLEAVELRIL